jgi:hypothetical protein
LWDAVRVIRVMRVIRVVRVMRVIRMIRVVRVTRFYVRIRLTKVATLGLGKRLGSQVKPVQPKKWKNY